MISKFKPDANKLVTSEYGITYYRDPPCICTDARPGYFTRGCLIHDEQAFRYAVLDAIAEVLRLLDYEAQ
jgi:hypothetical protein